jgi:hypothetical protein
MEAIFNLKTDKSDPKNASIAKQAENFWSMLNNMAESDPVAYKYQSNQNIKFYKLMINF